MVTYLNKSDASEGFDQIIDFLNGSYIKYALTINPHIYVSYIKQFWNTVVVKQSNDVTRLQALVDKKKVVITEATSRDALRLDDAEGVDCLPNKEIFVELARISYEKPSTKLTFYKAFFSTQWKFLIHTILQSMSAKYISWNEFSSAMASDVICLSTGQKFNFTKYIFESLVRNVDSSSKFYMYPRVGKGFSRVETPLFEGMLVAGEFEEQGDAEKQVQDDIDNAAAQGADTAVEGDDVHEPSIPSPTPSTPPPQQSQDLPSTSQVQHTPPHSSLPQLQPPPQAQPQAVDFPMSLLQEALDACTALNRRVEHLEYDKVAQALEITKLKRRVKQLERGNKVKVLKLRRLKKVGTSQRIESSDDNEMEDASNQERMTDVLMVDKEDEKKTEEAMGAGDDQEDEPKVQEVVDVVTTAKLITEVVSAASESVPAASITIAAVGPQVLAAIITVALVRVTAALTKRRKGVVIRDPEEESTVIIPADTKSKDKQKVKEDPYVQRYQVMKKRPQTEAQARRNMIMYLKNVAGFRLDYFKGMSYDDIRPIFKAKFNSNIEFLLKSKEQIEEEDNRAIQSINKTPAQKAAKRRKLNEEVKDLKQHLEIVPDEDDDVYTEATPLARKVPVVDYEIIHFNNKPHYKIILKERFSTSKPNNFSDDYLLTTLGVMFKRPDGQAQVWKNQRTVHGQARVKSWKLLESCGVHIITFITTQLILLVEKRYPLSRFTLDQILNTVRLRVEEQSEMALELLSFGMDAAMDHEENTKCLMLLVNTANGMLMMSKTSAAVGILMKK
nr:hypothetical protein [Tanacetum cinerariifolium]